MKNKILFSLFTLFLSFSLLASPEPVHAEGSKTVQAAPGDPDAATIIQQIIDVVGLKPNFEVKAANVLNAAAVVYGGKRYILYNPNFFNGLTRATGNKWAAVSVLAHEIGHHLDGHTLTGSGSRPETELEADEFSGFVLRKMGASLNDAQAAMKMAAQQRSSATHPGQYDRLTAIADGWNKADAQLTGRTYVAQARKPEPPAVAAVAPPATGSRMSQSRIIGDVRFNSDASSAFYVTSDYNLVQVQGNRLSVIGKLAERNSRDYPYLIYDASDTRLLVDAYGNILTLSGRQVGKLSARG